MCVKFTVRMQVESISCGLRLRGQASPVKFRQHGSSHVFLPYCMQSVRVQVVACIAIALMFTGLQLDKY